MVPFGTGQVILGGYGIGGAQSKIYYITCFNQIFTISVLSKELSFPRSHFVAIPIQDSISGCISESKYLFSVRQEDLQIQWWHSICNPL